MCDVVLRVLCFSFVSLKVKPVTEFNSPEKQIGKYKHNKVKIFPIKEQKRRICDCNLVLVSGHEPEVNREDKVIRPAAHLTGNIIIKI